MLVPKRTMVAPDVGFGICLWRFPDGSYVRDKEGNYLVAQGSLNDPIIERKMVSAARSLGITDGTFFWLPGFRKITDDEYEGQMADLIDGKIPDPVDIWRQSNG